METPDTTPVQGDGGDVDMVDEPVFKVPNKRKKQGQDVLDVLRDSVRRGELPLSCRRAVLTLLPKKGDLTNLKNWCPVSLLCTHCKLLSKALASRLTKSFYRGLFKIWNCFRKRNKGCGTLHWLLEEPLIHGGHLDISGVTAPALSRALISSRVVTLRELVKITGTDLSRAEDLVARLGLRSLRVVKQLLRQWRTVLTSKERVQLMGYQITETNPAEERSFPQLDIAPDLDGSEGPHLECWGVREMDF
ncbi:hypothetical protein QTP70_030047, partial [Hemibagrus guttatus]